MKNWKIALVHDYLSSYGGAEAVLAVLHEMYPEAPIYTIFSDVKKVHGDILSEEFGEARIITSWFDKVPFRKRLMSPFLWLIPLIWGSFDFSDYDLVISSASWAITKGFAPSFAKATAGKGKPAEICYCHTPPRYLYGYDTSGPWKKYFFVRLYAAIVGHFMRLYDFKRAQRVTQFVANSQEVAKRIKKFYRRDSEVIYPPVEIPSVIPASEPESMKNVSGSRVKHGMTDRESGNYFLTGGRLEAAKNFDVIIKACKQLKVPLKVFGTGAEEANLRSITDTAVEFLGRISEEEKFSLMAGCKAFVVAAKDEDFGITPVEAMACGRPVIAYRGGGYLETVVEGKTGTFFEEDSVESLVEAIEKVGKMKIKKEDCQQQAGKFSKKRFIRKVKNLIVTLSFRT